MERHRDREDQSKKRQFDAHLPVKPSSCLGVGAAVFDARSRWSHAFPSGLSGGTSPLLLAPGAVESTPSIDYHERNTPSRSMPGSSSASKLVCALVAVWSGLGCLEGLRAFFDFLNQHIVGYGNQGAMSAVLTPDGDPCLTRVAGRVQTQTQVIGPAVPGTSTEDIDRHSKYPAYIPNLRQHRPIQE